VKKGWFCPDTIIWHKNNPIPNTAGQLTNSFEYIFCFSKYPRVSFAEDKKQYIKNVWEFPIASGESKHNAVFPIDLPERILSLFAEEGDIILDPFCGSWEQLVKQLRN